MANLEFCGKHNMVPYLKKPTGSEGFQDIVDFLNGSHTRYALTKNPTIYVSLIKKFWQTAIVRIVDNRDQEITATIDANEIHYTEASVMGGEWGVVGGETSPIARFDGISVLPTTEIFDQLSLMGYVLTDDKLTSDSKASNMFLLALPYQEQLGHESDYENVFPRLDQQVL
ncbi:hypothetical protein Tco_0291169 [Tanacetum coccineum]